MNNKNFLILEIGTFPPLSVNFILEKVKDRENRPTYYRMISTQSIQQLKISLQNWMKNDNSIYLSNIQNFSPI
jgi:hypothetical protein